VISVDIEERPERPEHPRLEYLLGSSASAEIVARVKATAAHARSVLVVLDSEHSCDHVVEELHAYGPLVTRGSYLIVEDTNINGHPILRNYGPGPMEAIDEFLRGGAPFMVDSSREKLVVSFSPRGFLRRVGDDESVGGKPEPSGSPRELG